MKLKPLHDRIVVRSAPKESVSAGGIILPDAAQEKPQRGEVLAVGPGKTLDSGKLAPVDVKVGDIVLYGKYGGTEVTVGGVDYTILRADDVLAVVSGVSSPKVSSTMTAKAVVKTAVKSGAKAAKAPKKNTASKPKKLAGKR